MRDHVTIVTTVEPRDDEAEGPGNGGLSLFLLGQVQAEAGGRPVRLRSRKARAALGYLALAPRAEEARERLVGLLWSESEEDKARASLRQVVHELREALAAAGLPEHLRAGRLAIGLEPAGLATDMGAVLAAAEAGRVHPLLETTRLPDSLLEGLDDLDPAFRVWLLARRQAFHDRLMHLLEPRARAAGPQRRAFAQAILRLDPTHEEACRTLMEAAATEGDTAAALRAYEQLWTLLEDEYDMEPSAPTQALVAEIKSGRFEARVVPPAVAAPAPVPALATAEVAASVTAAPVAAAARVALLVEPFSMNGVPPENLHLVEGFRHELIACLVRFREWFVVSGPANTPLPQDARVSTRYGISATAYQAGQRMSLMMTLAERDSGLYVWSERMDLSLEGWFEAQQRVVQRISTALNAQLSAERLQRLSAVIDVPLDAYDRWLRAQSLIRRFRADHWAEAERLFHECIERNPGFSPAWSGLAQMDNSIHIASPGTLRTRAREERALTFARRAVQADPTDSRAHLCLAWSYMLSGAHAQGATHVALACDLNPGDAWTLVSAALMHAYAGQHDRGAELAARALETTLAPTALDWTYLSIIYYLGGQDEMALNACERAGDGICVQAAWRAATLARLGRTGEAAQAARQFLDRARAEWGGAEPATPAAITRWLLHLYPIRQAADWQRWRDGLARAGLPATGVVFGQW